MVLVREKAAREGARECLHTGAITKGIAGEELAPIGSLKNAGVVAITDDGHCVQKNEMMRRAMEYAKMFDLPVLDHCQDYSLVSDGVMHEGYYSTELGLRGWPALGEEVIVARNILLAELLALTSIASISAPRTVCGLIREAKKRGVSDFGRGVSASFYPDRCGHRRERKILGSGRRDRRQAFSQGSSPALVALLRYQFQDESAFENRARP